MTLDTVIAAFGAAAGAKFASPAKGAPEEQLRTPVHDLIRDLAPLVKIPREQILPVGETSEAESKTRPDYAVTRSGVLIGFVELKAPGKGSDPRKYKGHDKKQWEKLRSLPNLIYTDGNEFSLWRDGERIGDIVRLDGDIETSGAKLKAPPTLLGLFEDFFQWQPIAPKDARQLAQMSARLCRLLRDEVIEQLKQGNKELGDLKIDWRRLLFPKASDEQFSDGYAQAVTFGLLMARAKGISLDSELVKAAKDLSRESSLIGTALRVLTDSEETQKKLRTSLGTLIRVLNVVDWPTVSKGSPDAWLYFYEDFLEVYDNELRKKTGSYYTPPQVVEEMIRLTDDVLRSRFALSAGLASSQVTVVDPAVGTGTFPLSVLRQIARTITDDQGEGMVPGGISAAVERLIAFEMQLGPFAVAQLRLVAELAELTGSTAKAPTPRMFVTDTLSNPYVEQEYLGKMYEPIAESGREANKIKRDTPVMVVIGNPPYKEKAKGLGGWIAAGGGDNSPVSAPLADWMPPPEWKVSAHAKHLHNLYIYFWRWATWKVFDLHPEQSTGVVCFITVAGFLNGDGFQKMRDYLRRAADEIWVIDCSPEGHQPNIPTRIFQGVQHPVCIVIASRSPKNDPEAPAKVRFRALPAGDREGKFEALKAVKLDPDGWTGCPSEWRAPFLPASSGAWSTYPPLDDLFVYNGSGVMPGRTWIIAPDAWSLKQRWQRLINAPLKDKDTLFRPHLRKGKPGDKHSNKVVSKGLPGYKARPTKIADERGPCEDPIRYGFRSFDRQWIIPDNRLINQPNPELWHSYSDRQVFLTAPFDISPSEGPALTFTDLIPDLHHYSGRGGRVFPLWMDGEASVSNVRPGLCAALSARYEAPVSAEDVMAYLAAVAAHPAFTARFQNDLVQPGLRIPFTAEGGVFAEAVALGRVVVWLHTFGERFGDPGAGRPASSPRLPPVSAPKIPKGGEIPMKAEEMPDSIDYDTAKKRLLIGEGYIENVPRAIWEYSISGKQVLRKWFSYREKDRERPMIGDRRPLSDLNNTRPDTWLHEYTTELFELLHVLGRLVELEPKQADLLERICAGPMLSVDDLQKAGAFAVPDHYPTKPTATESAKKSSTAQSSLALDVSPKRG